MYWRKKYDQDSLHYYNADELSYENIYQTPSWGWKKQFLGNEYKIYERNIEDESYFNASEVSIGINQEDSLSFSSQFREWTIVKEKR